MKRRTLHCCGLAACAALAAPILKPNEGLFGGGWGNPVDPDKDCKFTFRRDPLTIEATTRAEARSSLGECNVRLTSATSGVRKRRLTGATAGPSDRNFRAPRRRQAPGGGAARHLLWFHAIVAPWKRAPARGRERKRSTCQPAGRGHRKPGLVAGPSSPSSFGGGARRAVRLPAGSAGVSAEARSGTGGLPSRQPGRPWDTSAPGGLRNGPPRDMGRFAPPCLVVGKHGADAVRRRVPDCFAPIATFEGEDA